MTSPPNYIGELAVESLQNAMDVGDGLATFSCIDEEAFLAVAQEFGGIMMHRDSDERGITSIHDTPGRDPQRDIGLTSAAHPPHTDRPAIERPPRVLLLWCKHAASEGGEAIVVSGSEVVRFLEARDPFALNALSEPEAAIFRTGTDEVVSPVLLIQDGVFREVRLRFDPFVHFSWGAARALPSLERAIVEVAKVFSVGPGMGYALRNDLWLHGRAAYSGDREMLRIMIGQ